MDFGSVPQLRVVLTKENTETHESTSDSSLPKRSKCLRSRAPPALKQKREADSRCRTKKLVTAQSVVQKKINLDGLLSVDDDVYEPKEMHRATYQYNSSQPKVVLKRIKPEILQSLSDHSKNSEYSRADHSASPYVEEEETDPSSGMKKLEAQAEINGLLSSDDNDDDVHLVTCQYKSSQPKVVLRRIKPEIFQSLSDHNKNSKYLKVDHSASPHVEEEEETESPSRTKEPEAQAEINGHGLPSSDDNDDDDDVHHATCQYNSSQPKVVLTRINPENFQSLLNHSNNISECPRASPLPASPLVEKEIEPPSRLKELETQEMTPLVEKESEPPSGPKELETQEMINSHGLPSFEDDDGRAVPKDSSESGASFSKESDSSHEFLKPDITSQPEVVEHLDSISDDSSPHGNKCLTVCPPKSPTREILIESEPPFRREKPAVRMVTQKKINYRVPSSSEEEESEKSHRSKSKMFGAPHWNKRLRRRPSKSPTRETVIETEPPFRREKTAVRLVTQKKINYRVSSSSSSDESEKYTYKQHRRKAVGKDSGSDTSFSCESESSDEAWNPKIRRYQKKKVTESQLKKEAITGENRNLSEYEEQRRRNIERKLAFLESLKKLEKMHAESFNDD